MDLIEKIDAKVKAPAECETMKEVREGVDSLDEQIVALLAIRQNYMNAAARIKPSRDMVRDEARIEEVVANVKANANKVGLSHAIIEPVYRLLIEKCIEHEFGIFDDLRR